MSPEWGEMSNFHIIFMDILRKISQNNSTLYDSVCTHWNTVKCQFSNNNVESRVRWGISLLSIAKMAGSIKFLQFVQNFNQISGIHPYQSNQEQLSTNSTQKFFLTGFAQFIFSTVAFLVLEAESIFNYGYAFYMLIVAINGFVIYLVFIWQSGKTLEFIGSCEKFIEKSKCRCFHLTWNA